MSETIPMGQITHLPLGDLRPFKDHPFKVVDDTAMFEMAESIKAYGALLPSIARPLADGGYEIITGHRRHRGSQLAGLNSMPFILRDLDDNAATIVMVDSNIHRESLLPSERAFVLPISSRRLPFL